MKLLLVLLLFTTALFAIPPKKTVICGFSDWAPYDTADKAGKHGGIDYEIYSTVLDSMHCIIKYQAANWENQLTMFKMGRVDMVRGAGYTKERAEFAYYSLPYRMESFSLYVRKSPETDKLTDEEIRKQFFAGKIKPVIIKGYSYGPTIDSIIHATFSPTELTILSHQTQLVPMFQTNRIDAFIIETATGEKQFSATDKKLHARRIELPPGGAIHVMFSKKTLTQDFADLFNKTYLRLMKNGTLLPIYKKHGTTPPPIK